MSEQVDQTNQQEYALKWDNCSINKLEIKKIKIEIHTQLNKKLYAKVILLIVVINFYELFQTI